jgi:DNA-binding CsgD family transcriptional regulator
LTLTTSSESHHRDVVLDADFVARIRSLSADASAALERQFTVPVCPSAIDIQQTLSRMWNAAIAKLLHVVAIGGVPDQHAGLAALLLRIRDADIELAEARIVDRTELLRRVCAALARMHDPSSVDDLLNCVSDAAQSLGLDRALLPTIRDSTRSLHSMCVAGHPRCTAEIVAANTKRPAQLDDTTVASNVIQCRQFSLTFGTSHHSPPDDRPLAAVGQSASDRGAGLTEGLVQPAAQRAHPVLSVREVEVIELLAAGASNRRIARKLMIAEGTVKTHITHILRKLGAANRAEAVAYWLRGTLRR